MGSALLSGWLQQDILKTASHIVEPMGADDFDIDPNIVVHQDSKDLPLGLNPEVIVFAVKPQHMGDVVPAYKKFVGPNTMFLSIAAGTNIGFFESMLGSDAAIVRAMPNTPAAIGKGITVLCPNANASDEQATLAKFLLEAVGQAILMDDETLMDAVTAVSGSGPAYVFLLTETLAEAGVKAGLPRNLADQLALQTVAGAGALAAQSNDKPAQLRENVTSPGGTTFEALQVLMAKDGLQSLMTKAVAAATRRGKELAG
jgi:pyrroline-5-carboxylate reductase